MLNSKKIKLQKILLNNNNHKYLTKKKMTMNYPLKYKA